MPIGASLLSLPPKRPPLTARRLLAIMIVGVFVVTLVPLFADLFRAIPWPVRKSIGQVAFLGAVGIGLARLLKVKSSDAWPDWHGPKPLDAREPWVAWAVQAAVASLALPLLARPDHLGFGDWDFHLERFESIRRTILAGQFPWWTPWCRGGFPLASDPQCGVVSVATPLVLLLGTGTGLRLATVLCLMLAAEGARRLARSWIGDPWAAAAAALIYGLNGGVLVYTVAGHFIAMSYCALPWLIHSAQRLGSRAGSGVRLGFWVAFDLCNGVQYPSIYALVLAAVAWLRAFRVQPVPRRGAFLAQTTAAIGTCLALAGWRIATTLAVLADFPREHHSLFDYSLRDLLGCIHHRPGLAALERATSTYFWESVSYIGPVAAVLAIVSLRRGWRWWHSLALLCTWLAMGSVHWYHPSYWLSQGPVFRSMHVVSRWRLPAMLGVGLAVADTVARWRAGGTLLRALGTAAVLALAVDYVGYGHEILPLASSIAPSEEVFPGPATARLVNVEDSLGFAAILRGYGVIRGYEPLLGYDRRLPTARLWRGHPAYRGEAWTDDSTLEPAAWSPNVVVYQTEPRQVVHLNANPGSWWLVNGRAAFPDWRCAEWGREFTVRADSTGRLELRIAPKGLAQGIALHVAGGVLLVGALAYLRADGVRARSLAADGGPAEDRP